MLILRRSRIWNGLFLAALLLSLAGALPAPSPARASVDPLDGRDEGHQSPLGVVVTLAELPSVGKSADVEIVVSSTEPAAGVQVELVTSEGMRIEGERAFVIDLRAGEAHTLRTSVTPEVAGNHSVAANVSLDFGDGNAWGDSDAVYFYSDEGTATEGFTYQGDPLTGAGVPGPGNTMKFESEAFPDGSMPAIPIDENLEIPVDTGEPGGQDGGEREGEVAPAAGNLKIRGNVGMIDRNGMWRNQKLLVSLVSPNGALLTWTFSNINGNFVFNISNPGVFRIRVWANYRHSSMQIGAIRVVGNDLQTLNRFSIAGWHYNLPAMGPFATSEVNIGSWQPDPTWSGRRAFWIYQDLFDGFMSTWNQTPPGVPAGSRQPDGVTVEWQPGSTNGPAYNPGTRRVKLEDVDADTDDIALHEYGHAIMHNVYGFIPNVDCPSTHRVEEVSTLRCAWIEGWAGFFAIYVNWDPVYSWGCAQPCSPSSINFEDRFTPGVPWDEGDRVEGNVAASLWDFVDAWGDGYEKTNSAITPFSKIWDVFYNHNHLTFSEFFSTWTSNVNVVESLATLYQNEIDYGWSSFCPDYQAENDDNVLEVPVNANPADAPYQRALCTNNDFDWYRFEVNAGESYVIETYNLGVASNGASADTTLTLYRQDPHTATQLAYDDNGGGGEPLASRIAYTAPTSGELMVVVRQKDGLGHPSFTYTVDFTLASANVAPTVTAPTHRLYAGPTLGNPAAGVYTVDVQADWTASDPDDGIDYQTLQGQVDEQGFAMLAPSLPAATQSHTVPMTIGTANQLQVSATDTYGAGSGFATGESFDLLGFQETDFTYEGVWTSNDAGAAWGGSYLSTNGEASPMIAGAEHAALNTSGAYATVSFIGSSVALVGMTAPDGGYAEIYIDGELHGRADFYSVREKSRQVVFAVNDLAAGAHHTLEVRWLPSRNEESSGYQLYLDGVIALD